MIESLEKIDISEESLNTAAMPDTWEEPIPFLPNEKQIPINFDLLPPVLADMGKEVARTTRLPDSLIFGGILGILSIAAGKASTLEIKSDHSFHTALFVMGIAASGTGKTPIIKALKSPIDAYTEELLPQYDDALKQYEADKMRWDAEIAKRKKQMECIKNPRKSPTKTSAENQADEDANAMSLKALLENKPQPPQKVDIYGDDSTGEALLFAMQERGGIYAILAGEARQFLNIALGRYNKQGDTDAVLRGIGGDPIYSRRRGREDIRIPHPYLALLLFTQPDMLQKIGENPELRESGYIQRILFFTAPATHPHYKQESIRPEVKEAYYNAILRLCRKRHQNTVYRLNQNEQAIWKSFHDEIADKQEESTHKEPALNAWMAKQAENAGRIALLFYLVMDEQMPMSECLKRAIAIMRTSIIPQGEYAFGQMGQSLETITARRAWDWICVHRNRLKDKYGEAILKISDLVQSGTAGIHNAEEATCILQKLACMNYLKYQPQENAGARPSHIYRIRP